MAEVDTTSNSSNGTKWSPPYTSFTTLKNTIQRMADEGGAPSRIDRSYLSNMPGGVRSTFMASMKSMGLVDDKYAPTAALLDLVDADENQRKALIRSLVEEIYGAPLALPPMATQAQLESVFRDYGITGSTLRKAIAFFLAATRFADVKVSPHFKLPKIEPGEKRPTRARARPTQPEATSAPPPATLARSLGAAANHPLVEGLIRELPPPGEVFSAEHQEAWFNIAKATFTLLYKPSGASAEAPRRVPETQEDDSG